MGLFTPGRSEAKHWETPTVRRDAAAWLWRGQTAMWCLVGGHFAHEEF